MTQRDPSSIVDNMTIEISDPTQLPQAPLVSIYMLAYRHERFIAEAIEGVITQQCNFPIELIIGEDCSPDGTRNIIFEYQKKYPQLIRVLISDANVGAHANSARCRMACRGKYIAICEGDDYWHHRGKLQMQVDAMRASADITMCHTDFDRKVGRRIKRSRHSSSGESRIAKDDAYIDLLHVWTVMTATALYRADILMAFKSSEFANPEWPFGDCNLGLYASIHGRIAYLPISTATWRKVWGSSTNSGYDNSLRMALTYLECRQMFMNKFPVGEDIQKSVLSRNHRRILKRALLADRTDVFEDSLRWLVANGQSPPRVRIALARFILHWHILLKPVRFSLTAIQRLGLLGS